MRFSDNPGKEELLDAAAMCSAPHSDPGVTAVVSVTVITKTYCNQTKGQKAGGMSSLKNCVHYKQKHETFQSFYTVSVL